MKSKNSVVPVLSRRSLLTLGWGSVLALAGAARPSLGGAASASFASVTIQNHTPDEISAAAAEVFGKDGYRSGRSGLKMVFEKEASKFTSMGRDGVVAAQAGARTLHRVKAEIVPLADGEHRLQCDAFMVTGAGDAFFENEVRVTNIRSRPYQSLLNKVKKQLK